MKLLGVDIDFNLTVDSHIQSLCKKAAQHLNVIKRFSENLCLLSKLNRGLTGGFLLLQNFCVAISVSPHVCFILVLILISMFLR